jgi:hypothetical protein
VSNSPFATGNIIKKYKTTKKISKTTKNLIKIGKEKTQFEKL